MITQNTHANTRTHYFFSLSGTLRTSRLPCTHQPCPLAFSLACTARAFGVLLPCISTSSVASAGEGIGVGAVCNRCRQVRRLIPNPSDLWICDITQLRSRSACQTLDKLSLHASHLHTRVLSCFYIPHSDLQPHNAYQTY